MLKDGVIEPSTSPWNFPLLVVPKKTNNNDDSKSWRIVVDFRKLNDITVGEVFPLPNISEILDQLGKSQYFSTLDLSAGYHQVLVDVKDRHKTAFSTTTGHFQFIRMPFGLKGAPATFQRLMNTVLSGLIGIKCFVYLDDIVVYGRNIVDHNKKLSDVFECLRKFNLKLNPNKCIFMRKEVVYLGHIITQHGIKPDPSKISAIINYPVPEDTKSIKSFLGLVGYYRRFIGDFSKIAHPLTSLLKKNATFTWTAFCDEAFNNLRNALTISPILQFPDFTQTFLITTDASDIAIGAILSQMSNSSDLPIAYASRTLNKAETNYPTIEKELLAIVWGVNQFRPYIYGTKFKIITDHKPLIWLWKVNNPTSRLLRWRIKLDEYDYQIVHKPGKANCNADSLSRIKLNPLETKQLLVTTRSQTKTNLPNANREDENLIKSSIPTDPQTNLNNTTEEEKLKL